jgi:hypothetical protein
MVGPLLEHDRAVSPNIYGLSNGPSIIGQSLVPSGAPSAASCGSAGCATFVPKIRLDGGQRSTSDSGAKLVYILKLDTTTSVESSRELARHKS